MSIGKTTPKFLNACCRLLDLRLATGKIVDVEALLHWRHPELGLVPPNKSMPIAEDDTGTGDGPFSN